MESLFRQYGIYASRGQLYKPVDSENFLFYKEAKNGQILEEGITEAGSMASFTAAGTAYATLRRADDPVLHLLLDVRIPAHRRSDLGVRRLARQGLPDGRDRRPNHAYRAKACSIRMGTAWFWPAPSPPATATIPAYAYEIAVIIQDGIRRMYQEMEDRFYYLTIYNENYAQPPMPEGVAEASCAASIASRLPKAEMPKCSSSAAARSLNEALRAQKILAENYQVAADVWSVTSYNELRRDALDVERWNRLHPTEPERKPYLLQALEGVEGPIVASTDYMKVVADQIAPWLPGRLVTLGTDGFGRSENREYLRKHFENGAEAIAAAALARLARDGKFDKQRAQAAIVELGLDPEAPIPVTR